MQNGQVILKSLYKQVGLVCTFEIIVIFFLAVSRMPNIKSLNVLRLGCLEFNFPNLGILVSYR